MSVPVVGTGWSPTMWPWERQRPTRAPSRWVWGLGVGAWLGWSGSRDSGIVPPVVWESLPGRRSGCGGLGALLAAVQLRLFPLRACDLGEPLFPATERAAPLAPHLPSAGGLLRGPPRVGPR